MITIQEILNNRLLALSWKEPYGTLMLYDKIETRTWKTSYRGLILLCASKKGYDKATIINISGQKIGQRVYKRFMDNAIDMIFDIPLDKITYFGKAFSIGKLIDCRPMVEADEKKAFVKYYPDLYSWVFKDVTPIQPFDWKGSQGFREVTPEEKKKIILL